MIPENGSCSASASTVSASAGQQVSAGKEEVVVNVENGDSEGSGKQSSSHEDCDLQEWYETCSHLE